MDTLDITKGSSALIIGAGPIGLLHLLLLKAKGASVTVTDKNRNKLRIAKKLGSDSVCISNPPLTSLKKRGRKGMLRKMKLTNSIDCDFDYVFECTGIPEVWEESVSYVRRRGTVVLFGGCKSGSAVTFDAGRLHYDEITLKGSFHYTPSDVRKAYELLSKGRVRVSSLISGSYPLTQIQKAFEKLSEGIGIKYAIIP
jgi:L-iditol 2-dehydrogenase